MDGVLTKDPCPLLRGCTQKEKKLSSKKPLLQGESQKYQLESEGKRIIKGLVSPLEAALRMDKRE
jgi:hypothetical protein